MDNYSIIIVEIFKLKISGNLDSPINRIRKRFNDNNIFYRMKIKLKVRLYAFLLTHFK
jgi:hypothetical protein